MTAMTPTARTISISQDPIVRAAVLVAALVLALLLSAAMRRWADHQLGFDYGLPYGRFSWYDAWSGFGSDVGEFGIAATMWKHANCHEPGCWRFGHLMADGHTRSCWTHHPEGKPKPGHVARRHAAHLAR